MTVSVLGKVHRLVSGTDLGMWAARKLRNQCDAVIRARLNDGIEMEGNGELLLLQRVAMDASVFVDVGANIGLWSERFVKCMRNRGRGIAIEPSPAALPTLRNRVATLACDLDVVAAAAGSSPGTISFFVEPGAGETSSVIQQFSAPTAARTQVPVVTVDHEVTKRGIEFVDFLKIDAEGFDLHVIKGACGLLQEQRVGVVQFEYNSPWALAGSTLADSLALFKSWSYDVYLLKRDGLHPFHYSQYGEYFGYSNFAAISPQYTSRMEGLLCAAI